ncbi:MAG: CPBP family intramembrane metalloprotease, partial [Lachnospiraceae bacterium]|nr:CPBP family intramembrane metalloprotease [Lachnospiraceae bacterium]
AFKNRMSLTKAIIIVSLLFGVSHMSMIKILPTAVLGAVLAYTIHKSECIVTSSLIHFANNALAVVTMFYGTEIAFLNDEAMTIPIMVTMGVIAAVGIPIGALILKGKKVEAVKDTENA